MRYPLSGNLGAKPCSLPTAAGRGEGVGVRVAGRLGRRLAVLMLAVVVAGGWHGFAAAEAGEAAPGPASSGEDFELEDLDREELALAEIPQWYPSVTLRGALGYKDNVTLSHTAAVASGFWQSSLEALLLRLPTQGWQFNAYAAVEDVRYFDAPGVDAEQVVVGMAQATKDLGRRWTAGLACQYLYQNQVFDLSATYADERGVGVVVGHTLSPRATVRKAWDACWTEVEWIGTRQFLEVPLDSYWLVGPRFTLGGGGWRGSELTLSYQPAQLAYDTRSQADALGEPVAGTSLSLQVHTLEAAWTQVWDAARCWQTSTRLGYELNADNGSGFYDYRVARLAQHVRWRTAAWEISAQARLGFYDYPHQTVSATDLTRRQRALFQASLRMERKLSSHWRLEAAYHYDRSLSDLDFDDYQANVVLGGVGYEF